jgi:hypothetical protein
MVLIIVEARCAFLTRVFSASCCLLDDYCLPLWQSEMGFARSLSRHGIHCHSLL